jgi:hypothetical protein
VTLGRYREAVGSCQQALALHNALDERGVRPPPGTASATSTTISVSTTRRSLATDRPVALQRELGSPHNQAEILHHLGDAQLAMGAGRHGGPGSRPCGSSRIWGTPTPIGCATSLWASVPHLHCETACRAT